MACWSGYFPTARGRLLGAVFLTGCTVVSGPNTWDYQWVYTSWSRNWLNILPATNLVQNIGFGQDATHTTNPDPIAPSGLITWIFPLRHPPAIVPWQSRTMELQKRVFLHSATAKDPAEDFNGDGESLLKHLNGEIRVAGPQCDNYQSRKSDASCACFIQSGRRRW